ncbi:MAG: helix-turn-helix domain-containing protein [Planctomycetota bacterium]|nr:helix-turn-helix domain-containing protein [Planctomycetota bacterium]
MPKTNSRKQQVKKTTSVSTDSGRSARIDPPHEMAHEPVGTVAENASAAVEQQETIAKPDNKSVVSEAEPHASVVLVQQARLQAQQLAEHLRSQQQSLDRRESELQAKLAQLEQQERNNRLWLRQQHELLGEQLAALNERDKELSRLAAQLGSAESDHDQRRQEVVAEILSRRDGLDRREAAIRAREIEQAQQQRQIDDAAAALKDASEAHDQLSGELDQRSNQFDLRRSATLQMVGRYLNGEMLIASKPSRQTSLLERDELDLLADSLVELQEKRSKLTETEDLWQRARVEVDELRSELLAARQQLHTERQQQHKRQEEQSRRAETELENRNHALQLANDHLELRRAAVEQMRGELTLMQRDTLETRLAAEQILAQLAGAIPPAQLTHQIARSRSKLVDYYRLQNDELTEQRQQLEALAAQLPVQHEKLHRQRRELEQSLQERQTELEKMAGQLAGREAELDRQQEMLTKQQIQWDHERVDYQRQIRRLLAEIA